MNESVEWEKLTQFQHPRKEKDYSKDRHELQPEDQAHLDSIKADK